MTRIERRVLLNCVLIGALLISLILGLRAAGLLRVPEIWMYDLRARHFQYFLPPPTDQLVHLDIDDGALDSVGRWPWPRSKWAELIDEISLAGAKAVALDVLFVEPQEPEYIVTKDDSGKETLRGRIDHDQLFADALKRAGNVIVPVSAEFELRQWSALSLKMIELLEADPELTESELSAALRKAGMHQPDLIDRVRSAFFRAREEAVRRRVLREIQGAQKGPTTQPTSVDIFSLAELRRRVLPRTDESIQSPLTRLLASSFDSVQRSLAIQRFGGPLPMIDPPLIVAELNNPPLANIANASAASAFVNYKTDRDGVVRTIPLVVNCEGRALPQTGLSLALLQLGATPKDLVLGKATVTIRAPGRDPIVIPVRIDESQPDRRVPMTFDIPWFGHREWETMYDWPRHQQTAQHLSANIVWAPVGTRQKMVRTNQNAQRALDVIQDTLGLKKFSAEPNDTAAHLAAVRNAIKEASPFLDAYRSMKPDEINADGRAFIDTIGKLTAIERETVLLGTQLLDQRAALVRALRGKAVMVGFTATGREDKIPTPVHSGCPGVITHGVIFNAILSGRFWQVMPNWVAPLLIVLFGALTAFVSAKLNPAAGFLVVSLIGICYFAFNGLILFDRQGLILELASPQIAMVGVWSGCTFMRIIIESQERARITRKFRSYVDPTLVNYVIERPNEVRLEGETRELTVCFSDLAGFTTLSERMGDKIVTLLNEFLGMEVPVIRAQNGYVNKFLGDGIMFFFGAPIVNPRHAADAVRTSLLMQEKLVEFNKSLEERNLPRIAMRIGISTGKVVVGDAGSKDASDYTVLGDPVNLGSRLESVNKMIGTSVLMSERTHQLLDGEFLTRPVGCLQVVGKTEGVNAFEVLGFAAKVTEKDRVLCDLSRQMVDSYRSAQFQTCLELVLSIESQFGKSKLTKLYHELCERFLHDPPGAEFDGKIVFTEK